VDREDSEGGLCTESRDDDAFRGGGGGGDLVRGDTSELELELEPCRSFSAGVDEVEEEEEAEERRCARAEELIPDR